MFISKEPEGVGAFLLKNRLGMFLEELLGVNEVVEVELGGECRWSGPGLVGSSTLHHHQLLKLFVQLDNNLSE